MKFSNCELIALASTLSIAISQGKTPQEVGTLAAFFTAIGDNLAIIALENNDNSSCL